MTRPPEPDLDDRARAQVEQVGAVVRDRLGPAALGAYLYGSAVLGGLKPASDLDILVVTTSATTPEDKRIFVGRLLAISGQRATTGPARPIELTSVVQSDVRPWRYPPSLDFQYGDWWRAEFEGGELQPWHNPNPDLAVLLTMVLLGGRPLFGPPPGDVLDPVPRADLVRAMLDVLDDLLMDLETDAANVSLTLARIWTSMATGEIRSKDAAADWALARLPSEHSTVLAWARAVYIGVEPDGGADIRPLLRPYANHIVHEIRAAAAANALGAPSRQVPS